MRKRQRKKNLIKAARNPSPRKLWRPDLLVIDDYGCIPPNTVQNVPEGTDDACEAPYTVQDRYNRIVTKIDAEENKAQ